MNRSLDWLKSPGSTVKATNGDMLLPINWRHDELHESGNEARLNDDADNDSWCGTDDYDDDVDDMVDVYGMVCVVFRSVLRSKMPIALMATRTSE